MLEGKCIKRYYTLPENKYILWNKKLIHRSRPDYLWKLEEKIVIQRISGGSHPIVASIDNLRYKTFASVNNLVLKEQFVHLYPVVVALLNSNVLNWYYANNFSNNSTLTVNISKTYLEMLPLPVIDSLHENLIRTSVNEIIALKRDDNTADISELEMKINLLVYHLYNLTYDEVLIIDPQTSITRDNYEKGGDIC